MDGSDNAFPLVRQKAGGETVTDYSEYGLTKRELFAALAMQGIFANLSDSELHDCLLASRLAVAHADALIAELAKPNGVNHRPGA